MTTITKIANHQQAGIGKAKMKISLDFILLGSCYVVEPVYATPINWTGASNNQWDTPTNWSSNAEPTATDEANFPSTVPGTGSTVVLTSGKVADSLNFANSYSLNGGDISLTTGNVNVSPTYSVTINSALTGSANLTKGDTGTLSLGGTNTYSGTTFIDGGTLQVTGAVSNTSQMFVGSSQSNTGLTISGGGTVTDTHGTIGSGPGSINNVATVTGTGSKWTNSGNLNLGFDGDHNTLNIQNGGSVLADNTNIGGSASATNNALNISGLDSSLQNTNNVVVGYDGASNSLSILDQAQASNVHAYVGYSSSADNNTVTVSGTGSLWDNTGAFFLGTDGSGNQLSVSAGGKVTVNNQDALIGANSGSDSNKLIIQGANSEFSNSQTFYVGRSGSNNQLLIQESGLLTTKNVRIGGGTGFSGTPNGNKATVDGAGTVWNISGTLRVGSDGSINRLDVTNGGKVSVTGNSFLGYNATSSGNSVNISGSGSQFLANSLVIGNAAGSTNNAVIVENGGTLKSTGITLGQTGNLQIGTGGLAGAVDAPTVTSPAPDSTVTFNHNQSNYTFGTHIQGSLNVVQSGSGETVLTGNNTYTGSTTISNGTLKLAAATNNIASSSLIQVSAGAKFDVTQVTGGFQLGNGQTLMGEGSVIGNFTTLTGSTVAPAEIGTIGILTFSNDLSLGGTLAIDLAGGLSDLVKVSGNLLLGPNSILNFNEVSNLTSKVFVFAQYGNSQTPVGSFAQINGLSVSYIVDYDYLGQHEIAVVIPEPSTISLFGIAGLGLLISKSRKTNRVQKSAR